MRHDPAYDPERYPEDDAAGMLGPPVRNPFVLDEETQAWEALEDELMDGKPWRRRSRFDDEKGDR